MLGVGALGLGNLGHGLEILGCTAGTACAFIFPALLHRRYAVDREDAAAGSAGAACMLVVGLLTACFGTACTLIYWDAAL